MDNRVTLTNLKKWMKLNSHSVIDLDWDKLRDQGFSMVGLLRWELRGYKGSAK